MAELSLPKSRGRALTTSPPALKRRSASNGTDEEEDKRPAFHQRNLDHIKRLAERKATEAKNIQEERDRLEATRERLSRLVLSRMQRRKEETKLEPQRADWDQVEETVSRNEQKQEQLKAFYRSRYSTLLKTLQENNKAKQAQEERERQRQLAKQQKLKEELGLVNVVSKLYNPTIASLINAGKEEDLPTKVPKQKVSNPRKSDLEEGRSPEEDKEKQRLAREAADKIRKRAAEHLQQITEKRQAELRRELEAKEKAVRLFTAAREAVKSIGQNLARQPRSESPERSEPDEEIVAKRKTVDKEALQKLAQHRRNNAPMITDFALWKKRNRVSEHDRVFIIMGGYQDIRKALLSRDWVENSDKQSPCFDLKWTLKVKDIDFRNLLDYQVVNHFEKNSKITTKVGLSHSLRNLIWFNNVDIDTFFPRCFDASEQAELDDLITEIKAVKAESILRRYCAGGKIQARVVSIALRVCKRRLKDLDDLIDDPNIQNFTLVTDEEWTILASDEMTTEELQRRKHEDWLVKNEMSQKQPAIQQAEATTDFASEDDSMLAEIESILNQFKEKFPQYSINGCGNTWIAKPANLSRGRGIACFNTLVQLLDYLRKEGQWVVQKYIENPLLILNKKFDIRQWVLVTDFNPLTIWFYESCYLRFGVEDFDMSNLQNRFIHLTNNSVVKHSEKFDETEIEGSMWHSEEFAEFLIEQYGEDHWESSIKPKIKNIVKWSLESAQDMIEHRKLSSELFGYDIMLDENLNPWLIEINSSPAMDYSTPITKRLVKDVMEDCIKVLVDHNYASAKKKPYVKTGNFTLIYKAERMVEQPHQAFGLNLVCQGKPLK